jgi:stage II sporulation protein R
MYTRFKKEIKLLAISLAVGLGLAVLVAASSYAYSEAAQRGISENVLRFHVLANSDSEADQMVKELVRVNILAGLETTLTSSAALTVTRAHVLERLDDLVTTGNVTVSEAGFDYPVTAEITNMFFPTTVYGDIIFPPGQYETLTVTIGEGVGRNWWCLMFPPLCYVEMTSTEQTRNLLEENIPQGGFALLTHQEVESNPTVAVRFRIVEWWQNRRNPAPPPRDLQHARG